MTAQISKKNLLAFLMMALMAFLVLPTDSYAQTRTVKRGTDGVRTVKKTRNTAKDYTSTAKRSVQPRRATKSTAAKRARATSRATNVDRTYNRRTATRANRTSRATTNRTATNRATRATSSRTTRANTNRAATNVRNRNTNSAVYNYTSNQRNDYCNNYYRGLTNWNRSFWTSVHYTPSYYDLVYNRFPTNNNLRAERVWHLGRRYYIYDGIWFRKRLGRYYAVDAPIGAQLDYVSLGGELILYRGDRYVIYRGTAYRMLPYGGFQVVRMLTRF